MSFATESWSTQQLTEFLALVSSFSDDGAATRGAVQRAAEVVDAEVAAVIRDGLVAAAIGYPDDELAESELLAVAAGSRGDAEVAGFGRCRVAVVALDDGQSGRLLVARAGGEDFSRAERDLLRGMARVLALTLRMLQRQRLLERLSGLQRMIVRRTDPHEVLDAVVAGVAEMIGDEIAGLRLVDPLDEQSAVLVSSVGVSSALSNLIERRHVGEGLGGGAMAADRLVVWGSEADTIRSLPRAPGGRLEAAMGAPVHEKGRVIGSLVVASRRPGRSYTSDHQEILVAFAEHASLALTDATMVREALHQALHDPLTDLPNRALFVDRLEHALARSRRHGMQTAVLFLDIDRFKIINDSLGHGAGDELLVEIAARLQSSIRPGDTAARFGGDEFAMLLEDVDSRDAAEHVAMRVMLALKAPFQIAERDVFVAASIGIAIDSDCADDAIRDADLAMYLAKAQGKGRYVVFEPSMHAAVVERAELEADLQRVVVREQLVLHYQPLVGLRSGRVVGVEALVRWRHPQRGLIAPLAFIPMAEETQIMPELGRWILAEACRQAVRWRARAPLQMAVNLSVAQLQSTDLADDVAAALRESGLPPGALVLEITETALMHDVADTIASLRTLKGLGVKLAVDDFGMGYSSLHYLRRLPIDMLKIDKAFVDDLAAGDATLARAIIDLGESFHLQVVAEGIEHAGQRQRLLQLGCRLGQGFHFARPMPPDELSPLLAREPVALAAPRAERRQDARLPAQG